MISLNKKKEIQLLTIFMVLSVALNCSTNIAENLDPINPVVDLALVQKNDATAGNYYELSFFANNDRDTDFTGYVIYKTTSSLQDAKDQISGQTITCGNKANYTQRYKIQIGGTSLVAGINCPSSVAELTTITLSSGTVYMAIRSQVGRTSSNTSLPTTIEQVIP